MYFNNVKNNNINGNVVHSKESKKVCNKDKPVKILLLVASVLIVYFGVLWLMYGKNEMANHDPLNKIIVNVTKTCCSWWAITHILLFMIMGFMFPNCALFILLLGAMWEFTEDFLGSTGITKGKAIRGITNKVEYASSWWAGSFKDILLNTIGFFIGVWVRKSYETRRTNRLKGKNYNR